MKIILHQEHTDLPSNNNGKSTQGILFDPKMGYFSQENFVHLLSDSPIWHVISALYEIEGSYIAHMSLRINTEDKTWSYSDSLELVILTREIKQMIYVSPKKGYNVNYLYGKTHKNKNHWSTFFKGIIK